MRPAGGARQCGARRRRQEDAGGRSADVPGAQPLHRGADRRQERGRGRRPRVPQGTRRGLANSMQFESGQQSPTGYRLLCCVVFSSELVLAEELLPSFVRHSRLGLHFCCVPLPPWQFFMDCMCNTQLMLLGPVCRCGSTSGSWRCTWRRRTSRRRAWSSGRTACPAPWPTSATPWWAF